MAKLYESGRLSLGQASELTSEEVAKEFEKPLPERVQIKVCRTRTVKAAPRFCSVNLNDSSDKGVRWFELHGHEILLG